MTRKIADCRDFPSDSNCTLTIAGEEDEVVEAASQHAVAKHGHQDGNELRAMGMDMVDSPVGKTSEHAVSGTLTLMVGGIPETIARVKPILDCMGSETFYCGGPGMGHAMKITDRKSVV